MTTVKLSDDTVVPLNYDFNDYFEPLTVKTQGFTWGGCWWETRCTMLEAFFRMYTEFAPTFDPHRIEHEDEGWAVYHWFDNRYNPPHKLGTTTFVGGDILTNLPEYKELSLAEAIAKALWTNGVIEGGVKCEQSMNRLWQKPYKYEGYNLNKYRFAHIPVLEPLKGDLLAIKNNTWAHSVIYVGYRLIVSAGKVVGIKILFQNSWGGAFAKAGRAFLSEKMVEVGGADPGFIYAFNDNPANGFKMPEKRAA